VLKLNVEILAKRMAHDLLSTADAARAVGGRRTRIGIDLVQVSRVAESAAQFGDRFAERLCTPGERADILAEPGRAHERLAERFAAKEAALKAFDLCEAGINWRDIEVRSHAGGWQLALHGRAAALAAVNATDVSLLLRRGHGHVLALVAAAPCPVN
jgi:holo-[acyl-carrier protein] synthase